MERTRGRGSASNPPGRFESRRLEPIEDAWWSEEEGNGVRAAFSLPTTVTPEITRVIISRNDSPDVGFDRSINPYKGCEHGCSYCFARPTHSYLGLSPGLDFETKIFSKPAAAELLERELARPGYRCETIVVGANTDAYQPAEKRLGITRGILRVLHDHDHPVSVITKSSLIVRDLDLLAPMAERRLASVLVSITTLDPDLAARMEPRAASPEKRLRTVRALSEAGIPAGVLVAPVILGLTDSELERILEASAAAAAASVGYVLLRLPHELKELFAAWLRVNVPLKAERILHLIRETREGKLYDSGFGRRMRGTGPQAALLARRFEVTARRLNLPDRPKPLDVTRFRPPTANRQAGLFSETNR